MIFWIAAVALAAILLALAFGGKIRNLSRLHLRFWPIVFLSLIVQIVLFSGLITFSSIWIQVLYVFSLFLLMLFVLLNIKVPGMAIIFLGILLNLIVILVNSGYMPADLQAYLKAGKVESAKVLENTGFLNNVRIASEKTHLNFLGDWMILPQPFQAAAVVSPGDLVLLSGLFYLLLRAMVQP